jgi:hypothetical protein
MNGSTREPLAAPMSIRSCNIGAPEKNHRKGHLNKARRRAVIVTYSDVR